VQLTTDVSASAEHVHEVCLTDAVVTALRMLVHRKCRQSSDSRRDSTSVPQLVEVCTAKPVAAYILAMAKKDSTLLEDAFLLLKQDNAMQAADTKYTADGNSSHTSLRECDSFGD
jgi:hypothetical protein